MAICKFFQQGHCRKGLKCDFEHIKGDRNPFAEAAPSQSSPGKGRRKSKRKQENITSINETDVHINKPLPHGTNHKTKGKQSKKNSQGSLNDFNQKSKSKSKLNIAPMSKSLSFTKLPVANNAPPPRNTPTVKDYATMVLGDLAERPVSWHFSSYGLTLSIAQTLPFPFLGTTELSAEELRLQVYAEAAATGGRIENYVKVVEEMKGRAEMQTKLLIPQLETVISDLLRSNNVTSIGESTGLLQRQQQQQDVLRMTLQQRMNNIPNLAQPPSLYQNNNNSHGQNQSQNNIQNQVSLLPFDPLNPSNPQQHHHYPPQQQQLVSNDIIADDFFAFGSIPEMPPS